MVSAYAELRIGGDHLSHEARVAKFGSTLPHVLRDPLVSTVFALARASAGTAVGAVCVVSFSRLRRLLGVAVGSAGCCPGGSSGRWL